MSDDTTPATYTAPTTERTKRRIAFASQFRQRVDGQGKPIGPRAVYKYDPETGRLLTVTVLPEDAA